MRITCVIKCQVYLINFQQSSVNLNNSVSITPTASISISQNNSMSRESSRLEDNQTQAQKQAAAKLALRKQLEKTLLQIPPPKPPPPEMHFIPNPSNGEFVYLLGLEHVVDYLTKDKKTTPQPQQPFRCAQCKIDFTPVWKMEKDKRGGSDASKSYDYRAILRIKKFMESLNFQIHLKILSLSKTKQNLIRHFSSSNHLRILRHNQREEGAQSRAYEPLEDGFRESASTGAGNRAANGIAKLFVVIWCCRLLNALTSSPAIVVIERHDSTATASESSSGCIVASAGQQDAKAREYYTETGTDSTESIDSTTIAELIVSWLFVASSIGERCSSRGGSSSCCK